MPTYEYRRRVSINVAKLFGVSVAIQVTAITGMAIYDMFASGGSLSHIPRPEVVYGAAAALLFVCSVMMCIALRASQHYDDIIKNDLMVI